jgi:uncharacterized protein YdeI (YjbR/CyaY-like superfamily)
MAQFDSKVSDYIAKSEDFAKPVLEHWRQILHETCPGVTEAIKWGIPHFDYKGDFMCIMASHKNHCSFSFHKASLMSDPRLKEAASLKPTQRFMGKITSLADLPDDAAFIALVKEAMVVNEKGLKVVAPKPDKPKVLEVPDYFVEKLKINPGAMEIFENKSPSYRKDYIVWIADAKTDATRQKRMEEALEWIAEGKGRFWKYEK